MQFRHICRMVWSRKRANALVILEIFVSFLVIYGVTTSALEYVHRLRQPLGFDSDDLYTVRLDANSFSDRTSVADRIDQTRQIVDALKGLPEVVAVAVMSITPFELAETVRELSYRGSVIAGEATDVSDDARDALGIEPIQGRWFDESDDTVEWTPLVINRLMAERLFGDVDPIGQIVRHEPEWRVVGVVDDFRRAGITSPLRPFSLRRINLHRPGEMIPSQLIIKVIPGTTPLFEERVVRMLHDIAPHRTVQIELTRNIRTRNDRIKIAPFVIAVLISGFLMLMVLLGMIGVFWQAIIGRTNEIGLRRALGGARRDVYYQIMGELLTVASVGAIGATFFILQFPLLGVGEMAWERMIVALGLTAAMIYGLACLSGLYPAWLASRVEPAQALHYE